MTGPALGRVPHTGGMDGHCRRAAAALATLLVLVGCSSTPDTDRRTPTPSPAASSEPPAEPSSEPSPSASTPAAEPSEEPTPEPHPVSLAALAAAGEVGGVRERTATYTSYDV